MVHSPVQAVPGRPLLLAHGQHGLRTMLPSTSSPADNTGTAAGTTCAFRAPEVSVGYGLRVGDARPFLKATQRTSAHWNGAQVWARGRGH